jgi:hypothetical protein
LPLNVAQLTQALAECPHEIGLKGRRGVPIEVLITISLLRRVLPALSIFFVYSVAEGT